MHSLQKVPILFLNVNDDVWLCVHAAAAMDHLLF